MNELEPIDIRTGLPFASRRQHLHRRIEGASIGVGGRARGLMGGAFMGAMLARQSHEEVPAENRVFVTVADMAHPHVSITNIGRASGTNILIDWGDGTSSTTTANGTGNTSKLDHTYSAPGDYIVTVAQNCMRFGCYGNSTSEPYASNKVNVRAVEFSDSITKTTQSQFDAAAALVEIRGGRKISSISSYAARDCTALTRCDLKCVTSIGAYAFQNCSSLQSFSAPLLTSIGANAFQNCSSLQSFSAPLLTSIGAYAFQNCSSLQSFSAPLLTSIDSFTFDGCVRLSDVGEGFPNVESIYSDRAFRNCEMLKNIGPLPSLTYLGNETFRFCYQLEELYAPNVTKLGGGPFGQTLNCRRIVLGNINWATNRPNLFGWLDSVGSALDIDPDGYQTVVELGCKADYILAVPGYDKSGAFPWNAGNYTKFECSDAWMAYDRNLSAWTLHYDSFDDFPDLTGRSASAITRARYRDESTGTVYKWDATNLQFVNAEVLQV